MALLGDLISNTVNASTNTNWIEIQIWNGLEKRLRHGFTRWCDLIWSSELNKYNGSMNWPKYFCMNQPKHSCINRPKQLCCLQSDFHLVKLVFATLLNTDQIWPSIEGISAVGHKGNQGLLPRFYILRQHAHQMWFWNTEDTAPIQTVHYVMTQMTVQNCNKIDEVQNTFWSLHFIFFGSLVTIGVDFHGSECLLYIRASHFWVKMDIQTVSGKHGCMSHPGTIKI